MILAGIDYSYTSPAICIYDTKLPIEFHNLTFYSYFSDSRKKKLNGKFKNVMIENHPEYSSQEERFRNISKWGSDILSIYQVDEVCIEGYSMGATSGLVFNIAENTSLIKQYMDTNGIKFYTPAPTEVKKNFQGKGNAKKEQMVEKFYQEFYPIKLHELIGIKEMAKPIDDIVDSYAVLKCHPYFKEVKQ